MTTGSVILITGASDGIGRQIALRYAARKTKIILAARNQAALSEVARQCRELGSEVLTLPTDVSKEEECKRLVEKTVQKFGRLDLLVLNAGVSYHAPFERVRDLSIYRKLMDVNFWGYVHCTRFALPHLRRSQGQIGVVASVSGEMGLPLRSGYCASKFAVVGFFESLQCEIPKDEVCITIVSPGSVQTNMREHSLRSSDSSDAIDFNEDDGKKMSVEDCVEHIMSAIDRRKQHVVLSFSGKMGVYLKHLTPGLVRYFATQKSGGAVTESKL